MAKMDYGSIVEVQRPRWLNDFRSRDHLIPGGFKLDPSMFAKEGTVTVTVSGAGAALGATSIPLASAIPAGLKIPNGTILDFTGTGEYARLTADGNAGATTLSVEALDAAIEAADTATYIGTGKKLVLSGTPLVQQGNSLLRPAVAGDANAKVRLLAFTVEDADDDADAVLVRRDAVIRENKLPNRSSLHADVVTALQREYEFWTGAA